MRWQHPVDGLLAPGMFLDLVERHGLMSSLNPLILARAVGQAARWQAAGHDLRISVNLSASSLTDPDLVATVSSTIRAADLAPDRLVLEVTETTLMTDPRVALRALRELSELGVGVSIDDYGTGYSSLSYLADLPAAELKVDRSLTARVAEDERTAAIVASTIDLAHGLGLRLVAEGVEDARTLATLKDLGCDESQGFLHARPMDAAAFTRWLDERPTPLPVGRGETAEEGRAPGTVSSQPA